MTAPSKKQNALLHEKSLYLQQHAGNPVFWQPWSTTAWAQAKKENKLVLVSIGYSACHWCHVMEHECFEDKETAALMNQHFVCIKVDREERPDVDQVYMEAVQLMTKSGGWPLNCFTLPNGQPVYGGTYFPKQQWNNLLQGLVEVHNEHPEKLIEYAQKLQNGMQERNQLNEQSANLATQSLSDIVAHWSKYFDPLFGGMQGAPKFPLPNNLEFLLYWGHKKKDRQISDHVRRSLKAMSEGGIYDQIGGGFSRYATDEKWKIPHFEKMLYDNAQLISVYAKAFACYKDPAYARVVRQSMDFLLHTFGPAQTSMYSALDADSEGVEGLFYTWSKEEIIACLGEEAPMAMDLFSVNQEGEWEGRYILLGKTDLNQWSIKFDVPAEQSLERVKHIKHKLWTAREKRIKPACDQKSLSSWNALYIKACCDAQHLPESRVYYESAVNVAKSLLKNKTKYGISHLMDAPADRQHAFLEDLAFTVEALIILFEYDFKVFWLEEACTLTDLCFKYYSQPNSPFFWYQPAGQEDLIIKKTEIEDSVIPSSNSTMAKNLFRLGHLTGNQTWTEHAEKMLQLANRHISFGQGYSNWAILQLWVEDGLYELSITGDHALENRKELAAHYLPDLLFCGGSKEHPLLPLLEFRTEHPALYLCQNKTCQPPVDSPNEVLALMQ